MSSRYIKTTTADGVLFIMTPSVAKTYAEYYRTGQFEKITELCLKDNLDERWFIGELEKYIDDNNAKSSS